MHLLRYLWLCFDHNLLDLDINYFCVRPPLYPTESGIIAIIVYYSPYNIPAHHNITHILEANFVSLQV